MVLMFLSCFLNEIIRLLLFCEFGVKCSWIGCLFIKIVVLVILFVFVLVFCLCGLNKMVIFLKVWICFSSLRMLVGDSDSFVLVVLCFFLLCSEMMLILIGFVIMLKIWGIVLILKLWVVSVVVVLKV